jgi:hypothetical protein
VPRFSTEGVINGGLDGPEIGVGGVYGTNVIGEESGGSIWVSKFKVSELCFKSSGLFFLMVSQVS